MIAAWQMICFGILLVNVVLASRLLKLFKIDPSFISWKAVTATTLLLASLFFGINIASSNFQASLRQFLWPRILSNIPILICFSVVLSLTALAMLAAWFYSETVIFNCDDVINFQVFRLKAGRQILLGSGSINTPVVKRFLKGEWPLRYSSENFADKEQKLCVKGGSFRLNEKRINIDLPLSPTFSIHGFHSYPEDLYGEPDEGPHYPKDLADSPSATIAFTIANSSPVQIRIQNLFIRVIESSAFKQSTFPISEGGGNGVTPVM